MTFEAAATYPCEPETPGRARGWALAQIQAAVRGSSGPFLLDDAALVVSELVTNAMRAGSGSVSVRLAVDDGHLHVGVVDHAPGRPQVQRPHIHEEGGRGLQVVSTLADRWGVSGVDASGPGGGGKEVWADLSLVHSPIL